MSIPASDDLLYLNALNRISIFGPKRVSALLNHYGAARPAWDAPVEEIEEILRLGASTETYRLERSRLDPDREWARLLDAGIKCISYRSAGYPALLKELHFPPPILYFRGSLQGIDRPAVAIVGSRRCTFYGREVARQLAADLAAAGVTVVSGMALGIDTAAHCGSLENSGYTAAVIGCGLDRCYPPQNKDLMEEITGNGIILSEFPLGTEPLPHHFPQRNRIISGLTLGTAVVEATAKSGAIITANFALEQNREVFAVPGNVGSPYSRGCHRLIREGALLVESAADILEELCINPSAGRQLTIGQVSCSLTEDEKKLLNLIPYHPMHMDKIIQLSGMSAAETSACLLQLELKNSIRQTPGKYFSRV
jgi:DNA processing protein